MVVISPPGGVGEIASVEAARLGGSVKWFVVSAPASATSAASSSQGVSLTSETLASIAAAGGSMELAGATADAILAPPSDDGGSNGALSAVSSWCAGAGTVICAYDGAAAEKRRVDRIKTAEQREATAGVDEEEMIKGSVRLAAREAVVAGRSGGAGRIALLPAGEEMRASTTSKDDGEKEKKKGGGLLGSLFGRNEVDVPGSMDEAMGGATATIRYGELFGAPESSVSSRFRRSFARENDLHDLRAIPLIAAFRSSLSLSISFCLTSPSRRPSWGVPAAIPS